MRFVGSGEGEDDLSPFDAEAFVDALFDYSMARYAAVRRRRTP